MIIEHLLKHLRLGKQLPSQVHRLLHDLLTDLRIQLLIGLQMSHTHRKAHDRLLHEQVFLVIVVEPVEDRDLCNIRCGHGGRREILPALLLVLLHAWLAHHIEATLSHDGWAVERTVGPRRRITGPLMALLTLDVENRNHHIGLLVLEVGLDDIDELPWD